LLVALDEYGPGRGDYRDHGSALILKCIRTFVNETASRIGLSNNPRLFPFFEDEYATYAGAFNSHRFDMTEGALIPLCVSRVHRMRLGAVPITAHLVSNIKNVELGQDILSHLVGTQETDYFRNAIKRIDHRWEKPDFASLEMLETMEQFHRAVSVLTCDLVSCAVAGPAYLYALARFMAPADFGDEPHISDYGWCRGYPPLSERILVSLSFLNWRGLDPHFESIYFREREAILVPEFFRWVLGKVALPYTTDEHKHALGDVKRSLMNGNIVSSPPSLVLNALWDGVVHKSGYVDEMAAVASISAWLPVDNKAAVPR
jgi:hypothetical protein